MVLRQINNLVYLALIFLIEILNGEIQEKLRSKAAFSP